MDIHLKNTLIAFHVAQSKGNIVNVVRGTDTDILIILLGMVSKHEEEAPVQYTKVVYDCGQGNSQRFIDITAMHQKLEEVHNGLAKAMIGLHALTGTDYTSAFYKKGKKLPLNLLLRSESSNWIKCLEAMSRGGEVDYKGIESFICLLYGSPSPDYADVNELRRDKLYKLAGKLKNGKFPLR